MPPPNHEQGSSSSSTLNPPQLIRTNTDNSRTSVHSLHSLPSRDYSHHHNILNSSDIQHDSDSSQDEDAEDDYDSQQEEAGLLNRLSDEEDRRQRRDRNYSSKSRTNPKRVGDIKGYAEEDEEQQIGKRIDVGKANSLRNYDTDGGDPEEDQDGPHSPRGFYDRNEVSGIIFKKGIAGQMWAISREVSPKSRIFTW